MSSEEKPLPLPLFADSVTTSWTWKRLDAIADVYDCPHSTPKLVDDLAAPFVVRSQDVRSGTFLLKDAAHVSSETYAERIKRVEPRYGDLVYSREGTYFGIAAEVPEGIKVCLGQRMVLIRPDSSRIDHRFLRYWLNSPQVFGHIHGFRDGTVAERLNLPVIRGLAIAFPSHSEQRAIAESLSVLDDRITLLRETNATLEAIAQALFKSWFVDFDPVLAKQEGRAPEGMSDATAALFPDSFEESELGLVPKGWRVGSLADLAALNSESWTAKKHPDTVAYIDLANAKDNQIAEVTIYAFDEAPSRARRVLRGGDTIVGTVRPGNRSFAFIHQAASNLTASTGFAVLRPREIENTEFVYLAATQDSSIEHLTHVADGGAYPAVRPEVVAGIKCVLPSGAIMQAFHDVTAPLLASVAANQQQAQTLATLRDTLLPRLISGQLRLPEAEALIEEAT